MKEMNYQDCPSLVSPWRHQITLRWRVLRHWGPMHIKHPLSRWDISLITSLCGSPTLAACLNAGCRSPRWCLSDSYTRWQLSFPLWSEIMGEKKTLSYRCNCRAEGSPQSSHLDGEKPNAHGPHVCLYFLAKKMRRDTRSMPLISMSGFWYTARLDFFWTSLDHT